MASMRKPFLIGVLVMFDRSWVGYPRLSLGEGLLVFVVLFVASCFWAVCIRWYLEYGREEDAMEARE
jgi:hypothetical protein